MVKSEEVYSPQAFVGCVTGKYYCFHSYTISELLAEIDILLSANGYAELWNYPLSEIDHIVANNLNVVLVELTGDDENGEWSTVYRWFEVPEFFNEKELV